MSIKRKINIAIDGYSACGKSTLAKQLAQHLEYTYVDSGAMYRAISYYFIENNIEFDQNKNIQDALRAIKISFVQSDDKKGIKTFLNDIDVSDTIRSMEVASKVSRVAAIADVRHYAVALQQKLGASKGVVMDGRDIGTVVFPDAELKIFVTASIEVRTQRRYDELVKNNNPISFEAVKQNLLERDTIDTTRKESPLQKAVDAIVLDNTHLTREEQLAWAIEQVKAKLQ